MRTHCRRMRSFIADPSNTRNCSICMAKIILLYICARRIHIPCAGDILIRTKPVNAQRGSVSFILDSRSRSNIHIWSIINTDRPRTRQFIVGDVHEHDLFLLHNTGQVQSVTPRILLTSIVTTMMASMNRNACQCLPPSALIIATIIISTSKKSLTSIASERE